MSSDPTPSPSPARKSRARTIFGLAFGLGGAAILCALGIWQLQRLAEKEDLIAALEARLAADPVPLPQVPEEVRDEYLRVVVPGRYLPGEAHVLTSVRPQGPGFRILAPFETETGRRILIDRGYVPEAAKTAPRALPETTVTGALLWPQEVDGFTPDPDLAANFWFARDLPALASTLSTEPILIVAESNPPSDAPGQPLAQPLSVDLPNDHLQYAITWFGLAAVWLAMTVVFLRRRG